MQVVLLGTLFLGDIMKKNWKLDELIERFTLLPNEFHFDLEQVR